jgi:hypothetical protein
MNSSLLPKLDRSAINRKIVRKKVQKVLINRTRSKKQRKYKGAFTTQEYCNSETRSKDSLKARLGARVLSSKQSRRVMNDRKNFSSNVTEISSPTKVINNAFKKRLISTSDIFSDRANYYNPYYIRQFHKDNGSFEENTEDIETEFSHETNTRSNCFVMENETSKKYVSRINKIIYENSKKSSPVKSKKILGALKISAYKDKRKNSFCNKMFSNTKPMSCISPIKSHLVSTRVPNLDSDLLVSPTKFSPGAKNKFSNPLNLKQKVRDAKILIEK